MDLSDKLEQVLGLLAHFTLSFARKMGQVQVVYGTKNRVLNTLRFF